MKIVDVRVGKFEDYVDEIQQSYVLGFTPYRLHRNADGIFVTPPPPPPPPLRVYDVKVYVLDDVATMVGGDRNVTTDIINSKLVYFLKGDGIEDPLDQEV